MTVHQIAVTSAGLLLMILLAWFFFGPKKARRAELRGGVQEIQVTVKGGYSPDIIRVQQGVPARLIFDRQESSDCTSRVVFPEFGISKSLRAFGKTAVEFVPGKAGRFAFACGMNMVHGTLLVEAAGTEESAGYGAVAASREAPPSADARAVAQAVGVGPTREVRKTREVEFAIRGGGVTCPTCVANIEAVLQDLPGVDRVDVNEAHETLEVDPPKAPNAPRLVQQTPQNLVLAASQHRHTGPGYHPSRPVG